MSHVEETYNGCFAYKRVLRHQIREGNFFSGLENGGSSSGTCESFRTYKRRKNMLNFRSGGFLERESLEALPHSSSQSVLKEEETDCFNDASTNHLPADCTRKWRTFVLQKMYESLKTDDGGIKGCIKEALLIAESDSNEVLSTEPQTFTVSETLKRAFFHIIISEKFTLLCKLLFNNFDTVKFESFLCLPIIDKKMRDGTYDQSPLLFSSDIQPLWTELQRIGNELVSISTGLLDFSKATLKEAVARCFQKSTPVDCLVSDSCEQTCHVSCVEPAINSTPSNWHCITCKTTDSWQETHKNCVVCEKLTRGSGRAMTAFDEGHSSNSGETWSGSGACKICGVEMGGGAKVKLCENESCPFRRYHERCLTKEEMKSYGRSWFCPSCLCRECLTDKDDEQIVLCDCCDDAYHLYCLMPPRAAVPRGSWLCRRCKLKLRIIRKAKSAHQKKSAGKMDALSSAALS